MKFIQQTNINGGIILLPVAQVSITEVELKWLIEGLDALVLPDRSKRIKRSLTRSLKKLQEKQGESK